MNKAFLLQSIIVRNFIFNILFRHTTSDYLNLRILALRERYSAKKGAATIMYSGRESESGNSDACNNDSLCTCLFSSLSVSESEEEV